MQANLPCGRLRRLSSASTGPTESTTSACSSPGSRARSLRRRARPRRHRRLGRQAQQALRRPPHRRLRRARARSHRLRAPRIRLLRHLPRQPQPCWPSTVGPSLPVGPRTIPRTPSSPSTSSATTSTAWPRSVANVPPCVRCSASSKLAGPRRRPLPHHQPPDLRAQGVLSPGPALVSRQGHRRLRRLRQALADSRRCQARPPRHPGRLLPRPQRPLRQDHRSPRRRHQVRAPAHLRPRRHRAATGSSPSPLLAQLGALSKAVSRFDAEIAAQVAELPDFKLFAALPGAGACPRHRGFSPPSANTATVFPTPPPSRSALASRRSSNAAATSPGSTGASSRPTFLRQTFVEWAGQTIPHSFWAKAFYDSHGPRASPTTPSSAPSPSNGFASSFAAGTTANPTTNPATSLALQKRHSPLLAHAAQSP